jgi:hypothetical protein
MDHAVALVQAYLQVNGYFTVAEYPVLEALESGGYKSATDVDLLALRLCDAGGVVAAETGSPIRPTEHFEPDPELRVPDGAADLLIIEVKEGRAELNRGAKNPDVLSAVLTRFGLRPHEKVDRSMRELERKGRTKWPGDTWVRMLAFGSIVDPKITVGFQAISLPHVMQYLRAYLEQHWDALRHAHIRHEAFGFLALLEQVRRAEAR